MLGRLSGPTCRTRFNEHVVEIPPLRNPGPTGHHDNHDPNMPGALGDTPGPMGNGDYAEAAANTFSQWMSKRLSERLRRYRPKEIDLGKLKEQIERHEGNKAKVYKNNQGHLMIGIGVNLDRPESKKRFENLKLDFAKVKAGQVTLTEAQIRQLFEEDVAQAVRDARATIKNFYDLPEEKKRVVVDLIFSLGAAAFAQSKKFIKALEDKNFTKAAEEMTHAAGYKQVTDRARELVKMMQDHQPFQPVLRKKKSPPLQRKAPLPAQIQLLGLRSKVLRDQL